MPSLTCIPDLDAFKAKLDKNTLRLILIFVFAVLPVVIFWIYALINRDLGYHQPLSLAALASLVSYGIYAQTLLCSDRHVWSLNNRNMARFMELVETWRDDPQVIQFVQDIHAQNRKPVNHEQTLLMRYVVAAERQNKREAEAAQAESDWQKTLEVIAPDPEGPHHA